MTQEIKLIKRARRKQSVPHRRYSRTPKHSTRLESVHKTEHKANGFTRHDTPDSELRYSDLGYSADYMSESELNLPDSHDRVTIAHYLVICGVKSADSSEYRHKRQFDLKSEKRTLKRANLKLGSIGMLVYEILEELQVTDDLLYQARQETIKLNGLDKSHLVVKNDKVILGENCQELTE